MLIQSQATQAGQTGGQTGVVGAIRNAAAATGTSFQYLLATAQVESGLNPQASASGSSARGLFQFIDQTWLTTMKESGPALGYGRYADAITRTSSGRYEVADPALKREIMALRNDPTANAAMGGAFTRSNADKLNERIGRAPTDGELYIAHFLGASGAGRLISMASDKPSASAVDAFPGAARANKSIFYDRDGNARTTAQVYGLLVGRFDTARARPIGAATAVANATAAPVRGATTAAAMPAVGRPQQIAPTVTAALTSATAGTAAVAATPTSSGGGFRSLFSDQRSQPVSPLIRDLWTSRPTVAAALTGGMAVQPTSAGAPLDLFSDRPTSAGGLFGVRS